MECCILMLFQHLGGKRYGIKLVPDCAFDAGIRKVQAGER